MKNAVILHGMPKPGQEGYYNPDLPTASNSHWIPWLQKQLMVHDIYAQTPEIPQAWKPNYSFWQTEFERYDLTTETILVGHSCGAGFLVRWLSEHPDVIIGRLILVAPWLDPERTDTTDFFDFPIDSQLASRTNGITIINSNNDFDAIQKSVRILRNEISDIKYRELHNRGHFTSDSLGSMKFPELLEEAIR